MTDHHCGRATLTIEKVFNDLMIYLRDKLRHIWTNTNIDLIYHAPEARSLA
jgi:hypothetical protein